MGTKEAAFPSGFIWGAASSAPQSEGNLDNTDWIIHERKTGAPPSGVGNGKLEKYDEDFLRLAELGITHYRTGIEWSRIEPKRGMYDREMVDRYKTMLETAERRGVSVWLTLQSVTLPAWFARMGGFNEETAITYWHRYVEFMAREFGELADFWSPIHEPVLYAAGSCLLGLFPPAWQRMDKFLDALVAVHRAHGDAYRILKAYLPSRAQVGMTALVAPVQARDPESDPDLMASDFVDCLLNRVCLDALSEGMVNVPGKGMVQVPSCKGAADFFGIDYFFRLLVTKEKRPAGRDGFSALDGVEGMPDVRTSERGDNVSADGFGAYPPGIYDAIKMVHQAGLGVPMYITASGHAGEDEQYVAEYLRDCLVHVHDAVEQGLDVRGYFHWTDVDLYEFNKGYGPKYGLYGFDPETMERFERPAAKCLAKVIRDKKIKAPE